MKELKRGGRWWDHCAPAIKGNFSWVTCPPSTLSGRPPFHVGSLSPQQLSSPGSPSFHHGSQLIGSRGCKQEAAACWPARPAFICWLSSEAAIELYNARAGRALINHPLTPYFTGVGIYTGRLSACIRSPSEAEVRIQIPWQSVHHALLHTLPWARRR